MKKFLMQTFIMFSLLLVIPVNTSITIENGNETIYEATPTNDDELKDNEIC